MTDLSTLERDTLAAIAAAPRAAPVVAVATLVLTRNASGLTVVVLLLLVTQLPTAADVAVAWRDGWAGRALVWRVRRWPAATAARL